MKLFNFSNKLFFWLLLAGSVFGQTPSTGVLSAPEPAKFVMKRSENGVYMLKLQLQPGYHTNSNTPSEPYLIPLKLTWEKGQVEAVNVTYPKPTLEKYEFSEKPLSVYSGDFEIETSFKAVPNAILGPTYLSGKLRYQACNDKMCLAPKTLDIKIPLLLQ